MKSFECILSTNSPSLIFDQYAIVHEKAPTEARYIYESAKIDYDPVEDAKNSTITFNPGCRVNFTDDGKVYTDTTIALCKENESKFPWVGKITVNAESKEELDRFLNNQLVFSCSVSLAE